MNALLVVALTAVFAGGAAGGAHCAGMCGGIVHAMCGAARGSRRGYSCLLFAYNGGRVFSYAMAGMLAGALGQAGLATRSAPYLQPILLALASAMLVVLGLYLAGWLPGLARIEVAGAWLWRRIQPWTRHLLPVENAKRAFALGMLWGWLPCGMVYAVLLMAIGSGSWWQGGLLLTAFGAGTLPTLLGLGALSRIALGVGARRGLRRISGALLVAFGLYGTAMAAQPTVFGEQGLLCLTLPGWMR